MLGIGADRGEHRHCMWLYDTLTYEFTDILPCLISIMESLPEHCFPTMCVISSSGASPLSGSSICDRTLPSKHNENRDGHKMKGQDPYIRKTFPAAH